MEPMSGAARLPDVPDFPAQRLAMVRDQLSARGVQDERVLEAMRRVPRELFVPTPLRELAYADRPLPVGHEATISQPYVVARMTELARVEPGHRVLEVGTGTGYQAAVLDEMGAEVFTIEVSLPLAIAARRRLAAARYGRVRVRSGDGAAGWPEQAPFDAIVVTAAPERIPDRLVAQLAQGARMVLPVGVLGRQELAVVQRVGESVRVRRVMPVAFLPLLAEEARV